MPTMKIIVVYGGALSGVSTALKILHEESTTPTCLVEADEDGRWLEDVSDVGEGSVVLVDGTKWLKSHDNLQALYDRKLVSPSSGLLVRLWTNDNEVIRRAKEAGREVSPKLESRRCSGLDSHIHKLSMPFTMVPNEPYSLDQAIKEIALKAGIYE
jgi:hypothetical protein